MPTLNSNSLLGLGLAEFTVLMTLFGVLLGSFLNVVIVRLPEMMRRDELRYIAQASGTPLSTELSAPYGLHTPGSHCPACKAPVRWWMNIPIISFIALKAKCAKCAQPISYQYPVVEILAGLIGFISVRFFGLNVSAIAAAVLLWSLLTLAVIDLNTQLLPDIITLPLIWLGLLFNLQGVFVTIESSIWGAVLGYVSLWSIYWVFKLLTGKEGMGYGDFKLFSALGAWLGVQMLLPILLFASVSGACIGLLLIAFKQHKYAQAIAFGPYLACGGVLTLFYGAAIVERYLRLTLPV